MPARRSGISRRRSRAPQTMMARCSNILEHMRASTPKSPWLEAALMSAGNMYLLRKDYDRAIDYYREIHRALSRRQQGGLRALEMRLADLSSEPQRRSEEIFRGAGRVLSRHERSSQRHVLARPHGRRRSRLRRGARLLPKAFRPLSQLLLRRAGAAPADDAASRSSGYRGGAAACFVAGGAGSRCRRSSSSAGRRSSLQPRQAAGKRRHDGLGGA